MPSIHEPVLLQEVIDSLRPQPGKNYIDCTFGGGGHSLALLERVKPDGKVLGIDWDASAITDSQHGNLILVNDTYINLKKIVGSAKEKYDLGEINGILLDLGLSSDQLEDENRGFSFNSEGDLDMRFDPASDLPTAADIIAKSSQAALVKIFKEYGDEPLALPIARAIITSREKGENVRSAAMLVRLIADAYRHKYRKPSRRNPATLVMQALRIAVNDEFGNIGRVLPQAVDLLSPGGRLAVISFHSGEDRIIKNFFRDMAAADQPRIKVITKKPIVAGELETHRNPRSRSALLRVAERI